VSAAHAAPTGGDVFGATYEALRHRVLTGAAFGGAGGLVVLLRDGLAAAVSRHGLAAQVSGEPPVFDVYFTDRPIVDYRATLTADRDRITRFNQELLRRGVVKAVNKVYVSLAHTDEDVEETLAIFDQALAVLAAGV